MGQDSPFSDDAVYRMRRSSRWSGAKTAHRQPQLRQPRAVHGPQPRAQAQLHQDDGRVARRRLLGLAQEAVQRPYYGKKPIYWLFQSPEKHFQALVYMHRMNRYTVQQVRQQYLHKYQQYLRSEIESLESRGEDRLSSKEAKRLDTLRQKADDARAYDALLKDIADQQIEIDLDAGVQANYPKFGEAVAAL